MAFCIVMGSFIINVHVGVCALGALIGFFGIIMATGQDILRRFYCLNEKYLRNNRLNIKLQLYNAIQLHSDTLELSAIN